MSEVVVSEIEITNFDLLRLLNGGQIDSKGQLFTIRTIKTWETKTKTNRPFIGLKLQVVTGGIDNPLARQDVVVKKVTEKVIVEKETKAKPIPTAQQTFTDDVEEEVI